MTTEDKNPFAGFVNETYSGGVLVKPAKPIEDTSPEADEAEEAGASAESDVEDAGEAEEADDSAESDVEDDDAEEADDSAESDVEDDDADDSAKPTKVARTVQERINKLTRARRDAERHAADLEERLSRLEQNNLTEQAKGDSAETTDDLPPPDPDDFEYGEIDSRYIAALAQHHATMATKALESKFEQQRRVEAAERASAEIRQRWNARIDEGRKRYTDFEKVVVQGASGPSPKWALNAETATMLVDSDVGADVAYYLATHPSESHRIYGMSQVQAAREIGKLEARFLNRGKQTPKVTKAPPPPSQQTRGSGGKFTASPSTTDFAAFEALASKGSRNG